MANGRLEMMMVLLFVMWSKRFMVEPITGASDWSGGALLLACFGGLDGGGEGNRDVLILARGLENNKERWERAWIWL